MKDLADNRQKDADDELTYKVARAATVSLLCHIFAIFFFFLKQFFCCCAETADGEPPQEAGCAERSPEGAAGGHQSQCTAGRGGRETQATHLTCMLLLITVTCCLLLHYLVYKF